MGQVMTLNGITKNVYSDEWYTSQETVNLAIGLLDPKPHSVILCPFDSDQSLFVKTLKEHGHIVLHGMNNFLEVRTLRSMSFFFFSSFILLLNSLSPANKFLNIYLLLK